MGWQVGISAPGSRQSVHFSVDVLHFGTALIRPDLVTSTTPPMGLPLNASALFFVIFVFWAAALLLATVAKGGGICGGWTMYRRVGINGSVF